MYGDVLMTFKHFSFDCLRGRELTCGAASGGEFSRQHVPRFFKSKELSCGTGEFPPCVIGQCGVKEKREEECESFVARGKVEGSCSVPLMRQNGMRGEH